MRNQLLLVIAGVLLLSIGQPTSGQQRVEDPILAVERGLSDGSSSSPTTFWTLTERMAHHGVPGVSIAVIHDFQVAWEKGYGVRDAVAGGSVDETTLFQAASISKSFTAAVALSLVEDGILSLDGDVNERLRSWQVPENDLTKEEKVTLRRLLSHSAGLSVSGFRGYAPGEPVPTILEILDGVAPANSDPVRVIYVPGTETRYSGGGYSVVQQLIEDVTGENFPEAAARIVFQKTGMLHSSFVKPMPGELASLTTSAHTREGEPLPGHVFAKGGSGCCGLWTTAGDLARFAASIQRANRGDKGEFLEPETVGTMLTPTNSRGVGLGVMLEQRGAAVYFNHSGGNPPGFTCYLVAHAEEGYGAVVMTNSNNGASLVREIIQAIASVYNWEGE
jgi:CubicO group peptidase (beta-lactamase class C family)